MTLLLPLVLLYVPSNTYLLKHAHILLSCCLPGHETTAATLSWTLYYVATHPEVEAKALAEIEAVLGDRFEPRVDDVPKLVRSLPLFIVKARTADGPTWGSMLCCQVCG